MPAGDLTSLEVRDAANRAALQAKLQHALTSDTPSRRRRPEVDAVVLADTIASHAAVRKHLPLLLEDATRLTGASTITLGDGKCQAAVVACVHVPPACSAAAAEARVQAAACLAHERAAEVAAGQPGGQPAVAYGVASNTAGLLWAVPPAGWRTPALLLAPAGAASGSSKAGRKGGLWRWMTAAAVAAASWVGLARRT